MQTFTSEKIVTDHLRQVYTGDKSVYTTLFTPPVVPVTTSTLVQGVLAYYKFDDAITSGLLLDSSGNGHNLTQTGSLSFAPAIINNGAVFSSGAKLSTIIDTGLSDSFSISTFVNLSDVMSGASIIESFNTAISEYWIYVYIVNGNVNFDLYDGTNNPHFVGSTVLSPNTDYYITVSRKKATNSMHIYINGVEEPISFTDTTTTTPPYSVFNIGLRNNGTSPLVGTLDEMLITSRALTDAEILEAYNTGLGNQFPFGAYSTGYNITLFPDADYNGDYIYNGTFRGRPFYVNQTGKYLYGFHDGSTYYWNIGTFLMPTYMVGYTAYYGLLGGEADPTLPTSWQIVAGGIANPVVVPLYTVIENIPITKDTWVSDINPTTNFDGVPLDLDWRTDPVSRWAFLQTTLPSGVGTIKAVNLHFYNFGAVWNAGGQDRLTNIYKMTRNDWVEALATWNTYDGTNAWNTLGGDFETTPIAIGINNTDWVGWQSIPLMGDGTANPLTLDWGDTIGVRLSLESAGIYKTMSIGDNAIGNPALKPFIEIIYDTTPPPAPTYLPTCYLRPLNEEQSAQNGVQFGLGFQIITECEFDLREGDKLVIEGVGYTIRGVVNHDRGTATRYKRALALKAENQ